MVHNGIKNHELFYSYCMSGIPIKIIWNWAELGGAGRSCQAFQQQLLIDPGGDRAQTQLRALRDGAWRTPSCAVGFLPRVYYMFKGCPEDPCNVFPSSNTGTIVTIVTIK